MRNFKLPTNIDLSKAILWQYEDAERLQQIINLFQDGANESSVELWKKAFFAFDLDKPINPEDVDYEFRVHGLHALSVLFGLSRPEWTNGETRESVSVNTWRLYLKGMIWLMDSDGSCEDINKWLSIVFPKSRAYVEDRLNMTIRYKLFPVPQEGSEEYQLIHIDGFLPHPAGVLVITDYSPTDILFGTDGQKLGHMDNSRLYGQDAATIEE